MDLPLEREQLIEIAASVSAVGIMFALLYWIGATYTTNHELGPEGGRVLVYAIVFFILLMVATGLVLAYTVSGPGGEESESGTANANGS